MKEDSKPPETPLLSPGREQFVMIAGLFKVFADASRFSILRPPYAPCRTVGRLPFNRSNRFVKPPCRPSGRVTGGTGDNESITAGIPYTHCVSENTLSQ